MSVKSLEMVSECVNLGMTLICIVGETSHVFQKQYLLCSIHVDTAFYFTSYNQTKNTCHMPQTMCSMRADYRLVRMNVLSFIEPIKDDVRKNSLMCKFVVHFQSCILIG